MSKEPIKPSSSRRSSKNVKRIRWKNEFALDAYELSRDGHPDSYIAQMIGVDKSVFSLWTTREPLLAEALARGRKWYEQRRNQEASSAALVNYVYNRLPEHLQELWDKISLAQNAPNATSRIESLFNDKGERARQHLWMYAVVHCNFNVNAACERVNISKRTIDKWIREDPSFAELLDELHYYQQNFFESALTQKVEEGDTNCIIFANRTYNRNRGYGESKKVEVSGNITHTHTHGLIVVDPEELELPLEMVETILTKLEQRGYRKQVIEVAPKNGEPLKLPEKVSEETEVFYQINEG